MKTDTSQQTVIFQALASEIGALIDADPIGMEQSEVILGVDTHLDTHVGAVISDTGRLLGTLSVATDTAGYLDLLTWANSFGQLHRAGVEGTGTHGAGLARL